MSRLFEKLDTQVKPDGAIKLRRAPGAAGMARRYTGGLSLKVLSKRSRNDHGLADSLKGQICAKRLPESKNCPFSRQLSS